MPVDNTTDRVWSTICKMRCVKSPINDVVHDIDVSAGIL